MHPPTYLRVRRRRRHAGTALTLRVQGLVADPDEVEGAEAPTAGEPPSLSSLQHQQQQQQPQGRVGLPGPQQTNNHNARKRRTAVWRRVTDNPDAAVHAAVVDAVLSEEEDGNDDGQRSAKRRRLTLLAPVPSEDSRGMSHANHRDPAGTANNAPRRPRQSARLAILSPRARLVHDSLQAVAEGTLTPRQHYDFVCHDTQLGSSNANDRSQWLLQCHATVGTILHTCALWNDTQTATQVLAHFVNSITNEDSDAVPSYANRHNDHRASLPRQKNRRDDRMLTTLLEARDGHGHTAAQVAHSVGHQAVRDVLVAYRRGQDKDDRSGMHDEDSDKDYVYDVYQWDGHVPENDDGDDKATHRESQDDPADEMACWLANGYWNETGELTLWWNDQHASAVHDETDSRGVDDDDDSNDEDWAGNDYPEDEDEFGLSDGEDSDDCLLRQGGHRGSAYQYHDEGDYDYAYGIE